MDYEQEIIDHITKEFLGGKANPDLKRDTVIFTLGVIDSFGVVELITGLEKKFGVSFLAEDLVKENLQSAETLARLIERKKK